MQEGGGLRAAVDAPLEFKTLAEELSKQLHTRA